MLQPLFSLRGRKCGVTHLSNSLTEQRKKFLFISMKQVLVIFRSGL